MVFLFSLIINFLCLICFCFVLFFFSVELFDVLVLHTSENGPANEQTDVLPALTLLCQWLASASPNTWNADILKKPK